MNSKKNAIVTASSWAEQAQAIMREAGVCVTLMQEPVNARSIAAAVQSAGAQALVLRGSAPLTESLFASCPTLRIVAKNGVGVDSIDLTAARHHGIAVAVAGLANASAVAEHAIALMLSLCRELVPLDHLVREGGWADASWRGRDFRGSVVGIVGYGATGTATARLAHALGARVIVLRRFGRAEEFETERDLAAFLPRLDILSLHCPLNAETANLIGEKELALLPQGALLINTARGGLVDGVALSRALTDGQLGGAGLDTFDTEPLPAQHPLRHAPRTLLTPHVAGVTRSAALEVAVATARNVTTFLSGRPLPHGHRLT